MLHTANANWNPSGDGYARLDVNAQFEHTAAAANEALKVSSIQNAALVEVQSRTADQAMTVQPAFHHNVQPQAHSAYGSDLAVLALGLVGAWLMVVGMAMIARRFRTGGMALQQTQ